jgi:AraC-like DNA-binding protein
MFFEVFRLDGLKNGIQNLLESFCISTNLGCLHIDKDYVVSSFYPGASIIDDFNKLGLSKIVDFVKDKSNESNVEYNVFYTYHLGETLMCNLCLVYDNGSFEGAVITQPFSIDRSGLDSLSVNLLDVCPSVDEKKEMSRIVNRIPIIKYAKVMPYGELLLGQITLLSSHRKFRQVFCGVSDSRNSQSYVTSIVHEGDVKGATKRNDSEQVYMVIKECIQRGDRDALVRTLEKINPGSVPMDQLDPTSYIKSLKYGYIKMCAMCSFAAVEAKAPYYKMMDCVDDFIRRVDPLQNVNDIYELMKATMLTFTRAVAVNKLTSYSKPVRMVMEYISTHFRDNITLEDLANYVGLSSYYLSNLIKKDTGKNLYDIINKIRIEESKKLLVGTNNNISSIADSVGYKYGNHYAIVFKKYTGLTPSEYRLSLKNDCNNDLSYSSEISLLCTQLEETQRIFPGIFDIGRVVDPTARKSWLVDLDDYISDSTCYEFWYRNDACENCISYMAYYQNETFVKFEQNAQKKYIVFATPKKIGKHKFVIEIIKEISDNFIDIE